MGSYPIHMKSPFLSKNFIQGNEFVYYYTFKARLLHTTDLQFCAHHVLPDLIIVDTYFNCYAEKFSRDTLVLTELMDNDKFVSAKFKFDEHVSFPLGLSRDFPSLDSIKDEKLTSISEVENLKNSFIAKYGVRGVVKRFRQVYIRDEVIIFKYNSLNLGNFIEFHIQVPPSLPLYLGLITKTDERRLESTIEHLMHMFHIEKEDQIECSYLDLVLNKNNK